MAASHPVADLDLSLLRNIDTYGLVNSWRQLITIFMSKHFSINNNAIFAVWHTQ